MIVTFTIPGSPIAQPRARAAVRMVKGKPFVRVYEPQTLKTALGLRKINPIYEWKIKVREAAMKVMGKLKIHDGPVRLDALLILPRPKYLDAKRYPNGQLLHYRKPDRDNCEKAILDALKGIAFMDDAQVCCGEVRKVYAAKGAEPEVRIRIETIDWLVYNAVGGWKGENNGS